MKRKVLKKLAVKLGISIPFLTLYFLVRNPVSTKEAFWTGVVLSICIDLVLWGTKKYDKKDE